jgi:2,4-dienoyl-CoA reductase-like NADH-dependent reductase (Old Yellow Enzyme family)
MADDAGVPSASLGEMWYQLAKGGVGLIVSGHAFVAGDGRCHPEMTGVYSDDLIPHLARVAAAAHEGGALVALQINHGGAGCDPRVTPRRVAPSERVDQDPSVCRALASAEITAIVDAYGQAARRAAAAGFDAVQIHGAHGYLVGQFLSPITNRRTDEWGGSLSNRMRFLREVARAVRAQVGPDFPMLIKLGVRDRSDEGLSLEEGMLVVAGLQEMGFDGVEISNGIEMPEFPAPPAGASPAVCEARFLDWGKQAKKATRLPVILVNGMRSRAAMEEVLATGAADFVSLCRPLICEPDLPNRFRSGQQDVASCITCGKCWPEKPGDVVECRGM